MMAGRRETTEADAEWSDASEDAVKSGSATDASKTEADDTVGRHLGLGKASLTSYPPTSLGRKDPVHSVLDKIDAELAAIPSSSPSPSNSKGVKGSSRLSTTCKPRSSLPPLLSNFNTLSAEKGGGGGGGGGVKGGRAAWGKKQQHISGSAEIYTDATLTDDEARGTQATEDFLSDLDSVVAQQIDSRFKEIMLRKKGTTTPPPPRPPRPSSLPPRATTPLLTFSPPTPLSAYLDPPSPSPYAPRDPSPPPKPLATTGYGTDNDSIKTEDFESRFHNLLITDGNTSGESVPKPRPKRAKNSSAGGGLRKDGGFGAGLSAAAATPSAAKASAAKVGGGGKVSFDVSAKEKSDGKTSASSSLRLNGLNRILQHSMKSLGETNVKEPAESASSALASLPPSGRSRSVSPERLMSSTDRPKSSLTIPEKTGSGGNTTNTNTNTTNTTTNTTKKPGDQLDSASEEIERQSARIQREMERERRCRSVSPVRGLMTSSLGTTSSLSGLPPRRAPTPARLQTSEFQTDTLTVSSLGSHLEQADKMIVGQELKTLRGALMTSRLQLKEAEKDLRSVRDQTEEARSELMLVDFKRTTAGKDLQRLTEDLERKRSALLGYDSQVASRRTELRDIHSLALSKEQAKALQEENQALKQKVRTVHGLELERDELGRQLAAAKEDLLREQKQSRLQREEMNEELETATCRLEEAQQGWNMAQQQLRQLDSAFRTMEREKNSLIQEQSQEYSALRTLSVQEKKERQERASQEVEELTKDLQGQRSTVATLQADNKAKDQQIMQLREEIVSLSEGISKEQSARIAITEEHRKTLQMLRRETDSAMLQLRESLFLDKQRALEDLRTEREKERRDSAYRADDRVAHMLAQNADLLVEKDQEILLLQEKVADLQELQHATESRMQENIELKIREAVTRERVTMESETQWQLRSERETLARDSKQRVNEMQMTLDRERETTQRLIHEIEHLKKELEEQRRHSREVVKEKALAVAKAKDEVKVQSKTELETMREQLKQDMQAEIDRLQGQLKKTEEERRSLRADRQSLESRERDKSSALERAEKTVITEINEECRRSATMLGITPRQVQLSNVTDSSSRAQITAALANLRAVNEELRNHLQEVTSELEACRSTIDSLQKEHADAMDRVRLELETQKTVELEKVKEKLIKEHTEELARVAQASARQSLANSMVGALRRKDAEIEQLKQALTSTRQQTADKVARLYHNQLTQELEKSQALLLQSGQEQKQVNEQQQREINRLEKEVQRLAAMQSIREGSSPSPQQQQQQYLQARIQQLNAENNELRRKHLLTKHNVSVPDLSSASFGINGCARRAVSPGPGGKLQSLEERLRRGEKEALMAEERARLKQSVLSQKMNDMAKLQNTLSDQNQELLKLERAYTQLHRQYNDTSPVPITHILNNTR